MSVSRVKKLKMRNFSKSYIINERGERVHVRWHFLATTEGGCNINNNHLLLSQSVVIITRSTWRL